MDYVINYDLPDISENYVHRVGRTGRSIKRGTAISFCSTEEKPVLEEIEQFLGKPVTMMTISREDYQATVDLSEASDHDWKKLLEGEGDGIKQGKKKNRTKNTWKIKQRLLKQFNAYIYIQA